MPIGVRMQGTVKRFDDVKGFGFITPDGSASDVFVHWTGISGTGFRQLAADDRVEFETEHGEKNRLRAVNVVKLAA